MKKQSLYTLFVAGCLFLSGCGSVPVTGRKQLNLVSNDEVLTLSLQQYDQFMQSAPKSTNKDQEAMVKRVGERISKAVERYMTENGMADDVKNYKWEFNLVKSNEVNAFCMPGGKIVVYEGILPVAQDETGLAVVMGHEVAHAVAKHANERMSQQMVTQYGTAAISQALGGQSALTQTIASQAIGLGSQYGVLLPFSRKHELEADQLGLIFMAMAGYDPNKAADFWIRMSQMGSKGPEFASTHPSDETRVKAIQKNLPTALKYYNGASASQPIKTNTTKTSEKWKF